MKREHVILVEQPDGRIALVKAIITYTVYPAPELRPGQQRLRLICK